MIHPEDITRFQERFNSRGKERLTRHASTLRQDLIEDTVDVFRTLELDDAHAKATKLARFQLWIVADDLQIPTADGEWRSSRSFALRNKDDSERLRFHIPVPDDFDDEEPEVVLGFEAPTEIFAERLSRAQGVGQTTLRLAVDKDHTFLYQSSLETGNDEEINAIDIWQAFHSDFDPGIDTVVKLNQDLVNWTLVHQREVIFDAAAGTYHAFDLE